MNLPCVMTVTVGVPPQTPKALLLRVDEDLGFQTLLVSLG